MTLPQNVKDALALIETLANDEGDYAEPRAVEAIRDHLMSQQAEIARLRGRAVPLTEWQLMESRLAAANERLEAAERDARGEREETWEIWEYGMCVAGADNLSDAQHYLTMYGQDGPVKLVRVISYRETVTPDAIAAATQEGDG